MARSIVMPSFGMYTAEGTVVRWLKPAGARVEAGEAVVELETEKALVEVTSPESGILHPVAEPGAMVEVESLLGYVLAPGEPPPSSQPTASSPPAVRVPPEPAKAPGFRPGGLLASPNVRRIARDLKVDLAVVVGSGPGGRIVEADVRAAAGKTAS
jgi:pyruvate dehydrogenase E2 component (dihydrolipoyllysine-residue acetyltransferase)